MSNFPQFNFPAFDEAAAILRGQGMEIINPAEQDSEAIRVASLESKDGKLIDGKIGGETWGDILARDIKIVADEVDGIIVLSDWLYSKGAKLEVACALITGKPIYEYHTGTGITQLDREWVKSALFANL
jgi:hypothetical protein